MDKDMFASLGKPMHYRPGLRKVGLSTNAALLLCKMIDWAAHLPDPDDWIHKSSQEIEGETGLTYDEQVTARRGLVEKGFIEENYKRLDHQMFYRIRSEVIFPIVLKKRSE